MSPAAAIIDHDNLEEFQDPANYDLEEASEAALRAPYFSELAAAADGPVLEIACGSGLITLPVAACNPDVTGTDICAPMLAHAQQKARQRGLAVRWIRADARGLDLARRFRLVYLTGNAFQAFLTRTDQLALLASVRRHLEVQGIFAFETRNPLAHDLRCDEQEHAWFDYLNKDGHKVTVSGGQRYDPSRQLLHWRTIRRWHDGTRAYRSSTRITCRFTGADELAALVREAGLRIHRLHGNWSGAPFTPASDNIIVQCKAA